MMNAKERRRAAAAVAIAALQDLYPAAFGVYEARRKPLKADIVAAGAVDKRELGRALSVYTCNSGYLRSMTRVGVSDIGPEQFNRVADAASEMLATVR